MRLTKFFLFYLYTFIFFFIFLLLNWIYSKFGSVSLDLILINLQIILFNFNDLNKDLSIAQSIIYWLFVIPLILTSFTVIIDIYIHNSNFINKKILIFSKNKYFKKIKNIIISNFRVLFISASIILLIIFSIINFEFSNQIQGLKNPNKSDQFKLIYSEPKIKIKKPKKLVVIFLESFDEFYLSQKKIDNFFLNNYDKINLNKKLYKPFNLISSPGTGWSMGSMVAVLCGVPYKPKKVGFLNNVKCIQDYTNEMGYKTEFISSTPINFHDLNDFLKYHKFDKHYTQQDFVDQGFELNLNSFFKNSISDSDLIDHLFSRLKYYNDLDKNFFIFAQTLDTHVPGNHFDRKKCKDFIQDNNIYYTQKFLKNSDFLNSKPKNLKKYYYELVRDVYENKYIDYVDSNLLQINFNCLSDKILDFIKKVDKMNIDGLSIYLVADHPFKYGTNSYEQNNLFNYIYTNSLEFKNDINKKLKLSHYDIFPYLLHLLGFKLKSEHAGVGYLFPKQNINLINREKILTEFLMFGSPTYDKFFMDTNSR